MGDQELKRQIEELAANIQEISASIYKLHLNQAYERQARLDIEEDVQRIYLRLEGWPVENWLDEESISENDEKQ